VQIIKERRKNSFLDGKGSLRFGKTDKYRWYFFNYNLAWR